MQQISCKSNTNKDINQQIPLKSCRHFRRHQNIFPGFPLNLSENKTKFSPSWAFPNEVRDAAVARKVCLWINYLWQKSIPIPGTVKSFFLNPLPPSTLHQERKLSQAMIFRALLLPRFVLPRECWRISARFGPWNFFFSSGGMEKFRAAAAEDSLWSESWMMKVEWVWVSTLLLHLKKKGFLIFIRHWSSRECLKSFITLKGNFSFCRNNGG